MSGVEPIAERSPLAMSNGRYSYPRNDVPVVSSGLPTLVDGFGGTCIATGTDVSRRGIVEIRSDASEFVRLSRHGRGRAASDT